MSAYVDDYTFLKDFVLEPNECTGVTRGADKKCSSRLIRTDATLDLEVRERMNCGVTCRHPPSTAARFNAAGRPHCGSGKLYSPSLLWRSP